MSCPAWLVRCLLQEMMDVFQGGIRGPVLIQLNIY